MYYIDRLCIYYNIYSTNKKIYIIFPIPPVPWHLQSKWSLVLQFVVATFWESSQPPESFLQGFWNWWRQPFWDLTIAWSFVFCKLFTQTLQRSFPIWVLLVFGPLCWEIHRRSNWFWPNFVFLKFFKPNAEEEGMNYNRLPNGSNQAADAATGSRSILDWGTCWTCPHGRPWSNTSQHLRIGANMASLP